MKLLKFSIIITTLCIQLSSHGADFLSHYIGTNKPLAKKFFELNENFSIQAYKSPAEKVVAGLIIKDVSKKFVGQIEFTLDNDKKIIILQVISVNPTYRKNKFGSKLFDFLKKCCKSYNYKQIHGEFGFLETIQDEKIKEHLFTTAKAFYKKQDCVLTFPLKTETYNQNNLFSFCWNNK